MQLAFNLSIPVQTRDENPRSLCSRHLFFLSGRRAFFFFFFFFFFFYLIFYTTGMSCNQPGKKAFTLATLCGLKRIWRESSLPLLWPPRRRSASGLCCPPPPSNAVSWPVFMFQDPLLPALTDLQDELADQYQIMRNFSFYPNDELEVGIAGFNLPSSPSSQPSGKN